MRVRIAREKGFARGRLIIAAVVDEEFESIGADALVREWRADAAVVTEPTDLQIAIGHKGFAWFEIETAGRAAHGSRPREGRDAILRMGRVLARLEALDRELQARRPHPVMGTGSLHASLIDGGREWSSYPDRCVLKVERVPSRVRAPSQQLERSTPFSPPSGLRIRNSSLSPERFFPGRHTKLLGTTPSSERSRLAPAVNV